MPVAKPALAARLTCCLVALLFVAGPAQANDLTISNVSSTGQDIVNRFILVQFDITWRHSWRVTGDQNNWDAVWVFVKYRIGGGDWMHATLNTTGHTAPSGSTIDTPTDGMGVFIYRSADGTGTVNFTGVQLRWNYGTDGLADNETNVEVQVLGIEVIYVPQGSFELGSGGSEAGHFYEHDGTGTPDVTQTYSVTSEGVITVGMSNGNLYYAPIYGDQSGPIPAAFPKGFAAFYIQKYEISQEQYAEFLNMLTYDQQDTRTAVAPNSVAGTKVMVIFGSLFRNGIEIQTPGVASTMPAVYANDFTDDGVYDQNDDGHDIACNWLRWADGAAYADWAGLRPMTELEYEKASRGTGSPVADEYAWGTPTIHASVYTITGDGLVNATVNEGSGTGNAHYLATSSPGGPSGPLRVGIFAASFSSPSRHEAGTTFYGVMEMSGNVWEHPVTISDATGRMFTGTHGDGGLAANGDANAVTWPGIDAVGASNRGGSWSSGFVVLQVSNRQNGAFPFADRHESFGFRAVRSAP